MSQQKFTAECGASFGEVSVPLLLEGIHYITDDRIAAKLDETQKALRDLAAGHDRIIAITSENRELLIQNAQMFEQLNRSFTRLWNLQMASLKIECPNIFMLMPGDRRHFDPRNLFNNQYTLYLLCQNPTRPHIVGGERGYPVPQSKEWWANLAPWLKRLMDFLRYIPKARAVAETYDEQFFRNVQTSLDFFEEVVEGLPEIKVQPDAEHFGQARGRFEPFAAEGPALRALRRFLTKADPQERWCGLHHTATSDGNILWLCGEHRGLYSAY
jgi:hypothetical protein